jgi:lipopolysaccharide transport system permease protein
LTKASACIVGNAPLVSKVYFPRLILPLSTVGSTIVDFIVGMFVMVGMMAYTHIWPGPQLLLLPVWLGLMIVLAIGIGLFTSAIMVSYRDLAYVIPVLLQLVLYASPVAYPMSAVPKRFEFWFYANPIAGLLEAFRWSLMGKGTIHWDAVTYSTAMVMEVFLIGAYAFRRMERRFADVI